MRNLTEKTLDPRLRMSGMTEGERFSRGFAPARRGPFDFASLRSGRALLFRQKDPKPLAPGRGPPGAFAPVPIAWAAELASLRQSSPPHRIFGTGVQPRPQAPRHGGTTKRKTLDSRLLMSGMTEKEADSSLRSE